MLGDAPRVRSFGAQRGQVLEEEATDEVYLRGQSSLRVAGSARARLYRTPGGGMGALAACFGWVGKHAGSKDGGRTCGRCSALMRLPVELHVFEDVVGDGETEVAFRFVAPARPCDACGAWQLRREEEARLLFEDLVICCDFPTGSTHVGLDEEAAQRRREIWRLKAAEAERIPSPWLGQPALGRRRFYRPAQHHVECYECGGDGACAVCGGDRAQKCLHCNGSVHCVVCRSMGEIGEL